MKRFALAMMWVSGVALGAGWEGDYTGWPAILMGMGSSICFLTAIHASRAPRELPPAQPAPEPEEGPVAPPYTKWSEVANLVSYRFQVAAALGTTCGWNSVGSAAMRTVIMDMGKTLDKAVDNAWAELPRAEQIERARNLGAGVAAQKEE